MKPGLLIRTAVVGDADLLAPRLRPQDRDEIYAVTGSSSPLPVLREGVACSVPCLAATDAGGLPLALFGVIPGDAAAGKVWLLGAPELMQHRFSVGRLSRAWMDSLHERYAMLWNYVDQRNTAHVRWLRWCGFCLTPVARYGFEQRPFYYLEHRRPGAVSSGKRYRRGESAGEEIRFGLEGGAGHSGVPVAYTEG